MKTTGRCYCGALKYEVTGQVEAAFQCHCRECQYITGGNPNIVMVDTILIKLSALPLIKLTNLTQIEIHNLEHLIILLWSHARSEKLELFLPHAKIILESKFIYNATNIIPVNLLV